MGLDDTVRRDLRMLSGAISLVNKERDAMKAMHVPWHRRVRLWRHGFLGESDVLYGLASNDRRLYVSDYARYVRSPMINFGGGNPVLNDKLIFYYAMLNLAAPVPAVYAIVDRGLTWVDPPPGFDTSNGVMGLLRSGQEIVLKPVDGGMGRGVHVISLDGGTMRVDDREVDEAFILEALRPGMLIQQRVRQGDYATRIFPASTNTIRVLTMWDYAREEPFISHAVHRFGTTRSFPVDNWSRGGLNVAVDVETGELGHGVTFPHSGRLEWRTHHPDTDAPVTGTFIPHWDSLVEEVLRISRTLPRLRYVGWDVLVGDEGFHLIEGNSYPELGVHQVHKPLLSDSRVRAFYQRNGVVPA